MSTTRTIKVLNLRKNYDFKREGHPQHYTRDVLPSGVQVPAPVVLTNWFCRFSYTLGRKCHEQGFFAFDSRPLVGCKRARTSPIDRYPV